MQMSKLTILKKKKLKNKIKRNMQRYLRKTVNKYLDQEN